MDRDIRSDLVALALLVLVAFLGLALVTYDPADSLAALVFPFNLLYRADILSFPQSTGVSNACGPWGALTAALLFDAIGVGAYYLVGTLAAIAVVLFAGKDLDSLVLRTIGWSLSLVGLCTLVDMLAPWTTPGPVVGGGGHLGALSGGLLQIHFATAGGLILAASVFLAGTLLCTDYVLVHMGLVLGTLTLLGVARSGQIIGRGRRWRVDPAERPRSDEVSVRVRGRRISIEKDDAGEHAPARGLRLHQPADLPQEQHKKSAEHPRTRKVARSEDGAAEVLQSKLSKPARELLDNDSAETLDPNDGETTKEDDAATAAVSGPTTVLLRATRGRRRLSAVRQQSVPVEEEREDVMQQLDEASALEDATDYELPSLDLLGNPDPVSFDAQAREVQRKAKILERTFQSFGFDVKVVEIETGPVIAQYEVALEAGLRLSKITGLADDLAIALRVPSVRIVAPIPGKNTVGIEVPNDERQLVRLREVMEESAAKVKKMRIPIFLGKDVSGNPMTVDLSAMPHLLIAGRTGTGKSVCLNAIIASILMTRRPDEVRMLMIDPKMVELSGYRSLPHLMHPVVTDMRKAEAILAWAVDKMEERYALLARVGVRHISSYNQLGEEEILERLALQSEEEKGEIPLHMPYIVIVADEIADLMMTAGKEVEQHIIRLAQKSRAVGIHLILATQKPTVDVITGLIKSNLPARIAFQVSSRTDSRVVLDEMGADKLLGNGDMLFLWPGTSTLMRGQGTYLSDEEINAIVDVVSTGEQDFVHELVELKVDASEAPVTGSPLKSKDDLYEDAIEVVLREGRGSVSLLQRALGIGYGRAARLIDFMAEDGIVGTYAGSQAREVLVTQADWERMRSGGTAASPTDESPPRPRSNRVIPERNDADEETVIANQGKRAKGHHGPRGASNLLLVGEFPPESSSQAVAGRKKTRAPLTPGIHPSDEPDDDPDRDPEVAEFDDIDETLEDADMWNDEQDGDDAGDDWDEADDDLD